MQTLQLLLDFFDVLLKGGEILTEWQQLALAESPTAIQLHDFVGECPVLQTGLVAQVIEHDLQVLNTGQTSRLLGCLFQTMLDAF
jgi:hypothetical protein